MKQTPAQIKRERDLLKLHVSALTEEVKRLRKVSDNRLKRIKILSRVKNIDLMRKEIEKIVLQKMQEIKRKNVRI